MTVVNHLDTSHLLHHEELTYQTNVQNHRFSPFSPVFFCFHPFDEKDIP